MPGTELDHVTRTKLALIAERARGSRNAGLRAWLIYWTSGF